MCTSRCFITQNTKTNKISITSDFLIFFLLTLSTTNYNNIHLNVFKKAMNISSCIYILQNVFSLRIYIFTTDLVHLNISSCFRFPFRFLFPPISNSTVIIQTIHRKFFTILYINCVVFCYNIIDFSLQK